MKIAVCDDKKLFRNELTYLLKQYAAEKNIILDITEFDDGRKLAAAKTVFDMIFLDHQMNELNGLDYFCVTANVPAKNMNDKITAALYSEDPEEPVNIMTSSVGAYLGKLDVSGNQKLADLVAKTKQYGEAAKFYFLGGTEPKISDHKNEITDASFAPSIGEAGMSLVLKSKLAVRLYIPDLKEGDKAGDLEATEGADGRYCFEIKDITPLGLGSEYTIEFGRNTYKFSPMSWCYRVMTKDNVDAKNVTMANALYEYYKAAKDHVTPEKVVDLSKIVSDYEAQDGDILTGTLGTEVKISIADGASVTLRNVNITDLPNNGSCNFAGITCSGNAAINLEGTNEI